MYETRGQIDSRPQHIHDSEKLITAVGLLALLFFVQNVISGVQFFNQEDSSTGCLLGLTLFYCIIIVFN